ncbi:unnamed protein product [Durusdinium trenchii]|uniref:Retrovirus-related Pol polyprotein from transposon TNT 1-94 n=2 Tax=Durusdinium trenchii TaxID=1381693 RepID=A0ABP0J7N2_9DINO
MQFHEELLRWEGADESAESALRERLARLVPGKCVLELTEENILSYGQGDWSLIERDLFAAFSADLAHFLLNCFRELVQTCLVVRRELINYKKLCLHMWQAGSLLEKDLRQLASFFYCELVKGSNSPEQERYVNIANAFNECRGALAVIFDARHFSKAICAWPRHVKTGVPWKFEALPESLELWKPLDEAEHFLEHHQEMDAYFQAIHDGSQEVPAMPRLQKTPWRSERQFVESPLASQGLQEILSSVKAAGLELPARADDYLRLVLVARGASKALALRSALGRYVEALRSASERAKRLGEQLEELASKSWHGSAISAGLHLHCTRHMLVLQGLRPVLAEMLRWLEPIQEMRADGERLFVSGAKGAAAFVPRGFGDLLAPHRAAVKRFRPLMLTALTGAGPSGWPRSARPGNQKHVDACRMCSVELSRLWLHRSLCLLCEAKLRSQGCCPYGGDRCLRSFCPHEHRCVVCEQWSCEQCQLLRGDGEDVWQLVNQRPVNLLFLDFDRTLCTTKAGGSPLQGSHRLDTDLATVCRMNLKVLIVTRSSRSEDIVVFLRRHGIRAQIGSEGLQEVDHCQGNVQVVSVKREGFPSKAAAILAAYDTDAAGRGGALFVDDDIKELTDPELGELVQEGRLLRLLFVRSGGKE